MKNRGAALDDAATSILAGSQWGGDLVLSVGAWWLGGILPHHLLNSRRGAGVPGRSGRHDLI